MQWSASVEEKLQELVRRYPEPRAALIPVLHLVAREDGFISRGAMEEVARRLGIAESEVLSVASFYTMLPLRPRGKFHIQVCTNVSCFLRGGEAILQHVQQRLGILPGETTPDGWFSLETVQCLAACEMGPVMRVNDLYYGHLTNEKVDEILQRFREYLTQEREVPV